MPIDALLKSDHDMGFTISPDGKYLAFIQVRPRQYFVAFTDLDELGIVGRIPIGDELPANLQWISKRRVSVEVQGSIAAVNVDGSEIRLILPNIYDPKRKTISWIKAVRDFRNWQVLHALPDNREEILVAGTNLDEIASVYRLDVFSGELTEVVDGSKRKISRWWVDRQGDVRVGLSSVKGKMQYFRYDPRSGDVSPMAVVDGNTNYPLSYDGKSFADQRIYLGEFSYDDDIVYLAENLGRDRFRLVRYRLSDQEIVDTVIEDDRFDIGGENANSSLLFFAPEQKLIGVRYDQSKRHTEWFDDRFRAFQAFLDGKYPNNINLIADWTDDLGKLLVYTRSDREPGKAVIYLTEEGKLALHSDFSPALRDFDLGSMQVIRFAARDGYDLEGYLTLPPHHDGRPVPAIVMPHGGPWARDVWGYDPAVQFFATRGFAVLQVNFRGSTGFGREHFLSGIRNLSTLMLDDIADGANWLVTSGYARADDLFIMGTSYGGYAALMSSIRHPNLYKAAVSLSSPLDLVAQIRDYKKSDQDFNYEYWKYAVGDPRSEKKFLKQHSPINRIDDLAVPFVIFHGDEDPIVSVEQARRFEKALKKSAVDGSVTIIMGEGHGLRINSNEAYFLESALAHFKKHLSTSADRIRP